MRAWTVPELGPPSAVLRLEKLPVPRPSRSQVLIRVRMAALNFPDGLMIEGLYQIRPPVPFTPGQEVMGEVVAAGADADVAVGARVIALAAMPSGGFAEFALAEGPDVFPVGPHIPDEHAACLLVTYQTGHVALHRRAGLQPGETLLVHAAAGGVGSAVVELGVAAGAVVIATAGGPEKVALCRRLGAHHTIDYNSEDFVARVLEITDGRGADVIYDPVGGDVFNRSRKCVAWEGRLLVVGFAGGTIAELPTNHALLKNYSVVGVHLGSYRQHGREVMRQAHAELERLYAEGALNPVVDRVMPLDDVPEALELLTSRRTVGKVLIGP